MVYKVLQVIIPVTLRPLGTGLPLTFRSQLWIYFHILEKGVQLFGFQLLGELLVILLDSGKGNFRSQSCGILLPQTMTIPSVVSSRGPL